MDDSIPNERNHKIRGTECDSILGLSLQLPLCLLHTLPLTLWDYGYAIFYPTSSCMHLLLICFCLETGSLSIAQGGFPPWRLSDSASQV